MTHITILQFLIGRIREENYFFCEINIWNTLNLELYCNNCEATHTCLRRKDFICLYLCYSALRVVLGGVSVGFFPFSVPVKHCKPAPSSGLIFFFTILTLVCESPEQCSNSVSWKSMLHPSADHIKNDWAEMICSKKNLY